MLLLLLPLREARRRSREASRGPTGPEAVSHGRLLVVVLLVLLLEGRSNGSNGRRVEVVSVGGALHFYAAVGRRRRSRRSRGRRRGEHPSVQLRVQHGQRREDACLDPGQGDDGAPRAALGQPERFKKKKKSEFFLFLSFFLASRLQGRSPRRDDLLPLEQDSPDLRRPRRVEREDARRHDPPPAERRRGRPLEPQPRLDARAPHERQRERREYRGRADGVRKGAGRGARARDGPAADDDAVPSGAEEARAEGAEADLDDGGDGEGEEDLQGREGGGGGGEPARRRSRSGRSRRLRSRGGSRWRHLSRGGGEVDEG